MAFPNSRKQGQFWNPCHHRASGWSSQGVGIRNKKCFHIMYNLHIKEGNIKGKYALSRKAMLFASI